MLASWRHRPAPAYAPADGAYRAVAAPLWRRGLASGIDWLLAFVLFLIGSYPFGMIQTLGDAIGGPFGRILYYGSEALTLGVVPAYFAYFLVSGHTLGMRALDIHVFSHRTGREPHIVQAVLRSLLALLFFYASFKAYTLTRGFHGEDGDTLTAEQEMWRDLAVTVSVVAILGNLWKLVDPDGRTIWDRLVGLVVVEDVVPASMPGRLWSPWGT